MLAIVVSLAIGWLLGLFSPVAIDWFDELKFQREVKRARERAAKRVDAGHIG